ncbi:MAG: RNA polymerase sigma factor [Deltaproteobacteria bacterium]|nr:RNA polymerase sigma factor [Deltaproteobacteria bacterium]
MDLTIKDDKVAEAIGKLPKTDGEHLSLPVAKVHQIINTYYKNYHTGLCKYLSHHLYSKEDIEDVAQEVYLRLVRHPDLDKFPPSLSFLRKIASNILIDRFRSQRAKSQYTHVPLDDVPVATSVASPERLTRSKMGLEMFQCVFEAVNEDCRKAFTLHRFHGLTYNEIAKEMSISKSMVNKHISHFLFELKKKFEM